MESPPSDKGHSLLTVVSNRYEEIPFYCEICKRSVLPQIDKTPVVARITIPNRVNASSRQEQKMLRAPFFSSIVSLPSDDCQRLAVIEISDYNCHIMLDTYSAQGPTCERNFIFITIPA